MTLLHDVYKKINKDTNHGAVISQLVNDKKLDINSQDDNGDTVLHCMSKYVYDNYHSPFFYKSNPEGKSLSTGYNGFYHHTNYQGPDFFDDLAVFLALGADLTIKNKKGETAIDVLFENRTLFINLEDITFYFTLLQSHHPHAKAFINLIEHAAFVSTEKFNYECRVKHGRWYTARWLDNELPQVFDERILPLDCLQSILEWIDKGSLLNLDASATTCAKLRMRIVRQINFRVNNSQIVDALAALQTVHRNNEGVALRGILRDDPACPLSHLIEQLSKRELEPFVPEKLFENLNALMISYSEKREVCKLLKVIPEPLSDDEYKILIPLCELLNEAMHGQEKSECKNRFSTEKFGVFRTKFKLNYDKVLSELMTHKPTISH